MRINAEWSKQMSDLNKLQDNLEQIEKHQFGWRECHKLDRCVQLHLTLDFVLNSWVLVVGN